jgi:hypothetical protein
MYVAVKYSNTTTHRDNSVGKMTGSGLEDSGLMVLFIFTPSL